MSIVAWLFLGLVSGFVASKIVNKSGSGAFLDIILGIIGAFAGGLIFSTLGTRGVTGFNLWSVFVSVIGAVLVLLVYHAISRHRHMAT